MEHSRQAILESPEGQRARLNVYPFPRRLPASSRAGVSAGSATRAARAPAWGWLYALLPVSALLCALAEYLPLSAGWRRLAEGLVGVVVIVLAWVWVRANRCALSRFVPGAGTANEPPDLAVEVQKAPPQVIPLEPRRSHSDG